MLARRHRLTLAKKFFDGWVVLTSPIFVLIGWDFSCAGCRSRSWCPCQYHRLDPISAAHPVSGNFEFSFSSPAGRVVYRLAARCSPYVSGSLAGPRCGSMPPHPPPTGPALHGARARVRGGLARSRMGPSQAEPPQVSFSLTQLCPRLPCRQVRPHLSNMQICMHACMHACVRAHTYLDECRHV